MASPDLLVGGQGMDDAAVYPPARRPGHRVYDGRLYTDRGRRLQLRSDCGRERLERSLRHGASPILALNIAGWPRGTLPLGLLAEVQRGAADKVREAGAVIGGGHSIDDPEPKFGLAVLGTLDPDEITTNAGARPDDLLVLTKPLGHRNYHHCRQVRCRQSDRARRRHRVHDHTECRRGQGCERSRRARRDRRDGVWLLGHLREMLNASSVSAEVYVDEVPVLPEVWSLIAADEVPGGTERNLASLEGDIRWHPEVEVSERLLLADAQTSGGLLIAIPPEDEAALRHALERTGVPAAATVGRITARESCLMYVRPTDAADDFDG